MKFIATLLAVACFSFTTASFTSCSNLGGVGGVVSSAQSWLTDPKNQALIQEIAQAAGLLVGVLGRHADTEVHAAVGKLAVKYPDVPAGALREIAKHPSQYMKR